MYLWPPTKTFFVFFPPEFLWPRGEPLRVHQPHSDGPPADYTGHSGGDRLLRPSPLPLEAAPIQLLPPPGGATSSVRARCRTLTGEGKRGDKGSGWSEDSAVFCHTAPSEALMGIKELSAGLISPLCHPALYCSGRAASAVPHLQSLHVLAHRKSETWWSNNP